LAIAIGVIGLAQESEGTLALARRQTLFTLGVLKPLPHEPGAIQKAAGSHAG
jgi:hypothetical protein